MVKNVQNLDPIMVLSVEAQKHTPVRCVFLVCVWWAVKLNSDLIATHY